MSFRRAGIVLQALLGGYHPFIGVVLLTWISYGTLAAAAPRPGYSPVPPTASFLNTPTQGVVARATAPANTLIQRDDAFVVAEGQDQAWVIGNAQVAYTVGFDENGRLTARELKNGTAGQSWNPSRRADATFEVEGRALTLSRAEVGGFALTGSQTVESPGGIELRLVFTNARDGVQATRVYAVYPGTPVVETWIVFEATGARVVALSNLASLQMVVDGSTLTWVRGQDAPAEAGGSFTVERRSVASTDQIVIEATGRSTQSALPMFSLRAAAGTFFGGYIWSGSWRFDLNGQPRQRLEATLGLGDTATVASIGHSVELPHAFFGVVPGDQPEVAAAIHRFIVGGLRQGQPFTPLVTYNSWFVAGTRIDRETTRQGMLAAAAVGVEVFEVDAGWYERAGEQDAFDFSSGLGSWRVDTEKFPEGLRPLGDLARELDMRFGVWVEPERVDLSLLDQPGMPREEWLAQSDGAYEPGVPNDDARYAMLDLGVPEARTWIIDRLTTLIEEQGIDYLKWDSNFWINNNRRRPGRGARDGNFEHVRGLYAVLAELKARFPTLLIENCSGGGNRLDLGMMRYTDVGWMDDRTSPAAHVRHNLQGLTTFLPPSYLLSYVISHGDEPMHDAADMAMYARSRMPGVLGVSFQAGELGEDDVAALRGQTDAWKASRESTSGAIATLLTDQADGPHHPAWDALALIAPGRDRAWLYAFRNESGEEEATILMRGLDPRATYDVRTLDGETVATATGAALMTRGVDVPASPDSASQVLELVPAAAADVPVP